MIPPVATRPTVGESDIAPVDLLGQLLDQVGDLLKLGMDRESAAEGLERMLVVAEFLQDHAEPGERPEVARLALEHFVDIGQRTGEILLREINGGAPVPGFDVIGPNVDNGVEQLDREVVVLAVHRGLDAAHQQVTGVAAGRDPERPDAVLDELGALLRGRDFERLEQLVEIELGITGLGARQVGRWLDQLGRLAAAGRGRVAFLRGCGRRGSHQQGRQENGAESLSHARSLIPRRGAAKAGSRQSEMTFTTGEPGAGRRAPGAALAGLVAAPPLVDHVDPALTANRAIAAVAAAQRLQRITNFQGIQPPRRGMIEGARKLGMRGRFVNHGWANGRYRRPAGRETAARPPRASRIFPPVLQCNRTSGPDAESGSGPRSGYPPTNAGAAPSQGMPSIVMSTVSTRNVPVGGGSPPGAREEAMTSSG